MQINLLINLKLNCKKIKRKITRDNIDVIKYNESCHI